MAQLDYLEQVAWALEALDRTASTTPIGKSGKDADRPELAACLDYLDYLRPGYTLAVPSCPGPGRLIAIVTAAPARGRVQEPA